MTNKAPMFLFLIYGITGFSLSAKDDLDQISLMNTFDLYLPIPFFRGDKISWHFIHSCNQYVYCFYSVPGTLLATSYPEISSSPHGIWWMFPMDSRGCSLPGQWTLCDSSRTFFILLLQTSCILVIFFTIFFL